MLKFIKKRLVLDLDLNFNFLEMAINEAYKYQFLTYPNPAVGAVVVKNGAVLSIEAHKRAGTSHAEVLALLSAYEKLEEKSVDFDKNSSKEAHKFLLSLPDGYFKDCTIYVTLEPCSHIGKTPSCANLLKELKPKRVVIGALDPITSHSGGLEMLKSAGIEAINLNSKDAHNLIEPFIIWQKRAFVLFKIAQSLNGQIGGGYLSSQDSLTHTHKIRDISSKLLIGGNTVRVDRPTLDARFCQGRAPDIVIYSKDKIFDKDIALFNVPNRDVQITDSLEFLNKPGFILVEGGEGMLNAMQGKIDWLLTYITPKIAPKSVGYFANLELEILHTMPSGVDVAMFSRVVSCY
jgi:diaminohydroxyphosphoribosylaminopyrimidine deaminase/5-amino-6-(5-phosphoribosylamino)uracil reductase